MHITILFTCTAFTFNSLGHCPMALQCYTLTPTLHNKDVFANTTKNSGDSTMYSY